MRKIIFILICCLFPFTLSAQQYAGMTGLIHVPSAEMDSAGDARIGATFLNKEFTPLHPQVEGHKYDTFDFYLSLTPFWWIEGAFVMTLQKGMEKNGGWAYTHRFVQKDRYFSLKINPLREGKWWPAVAVGVQDLFSDKKMGKCYYRNYYLALTKNLKFHGNTLGATLVYRKYSLDYNKKWNGLVGGITFRPSFAKDLRVMAEWTGCNFIIGADYLLFKHIIIQASLQDGKYPNAGLCYRVNLF